MSDKINIPNNSWIVVADGTGARLFSASIDNDEVSLTALDELDPQDPVEHGPSGSLPPEQTDQQVTEATFANQLAHTLYLRAHAGKYSALVVFADPVTLGQLRDLFHQEVTDRIVADVPKTLTNVPQQDLEVSLTKMLQP